MTVTERTPWVRRFGLAGVALVLAGCTTADPPPKSQAAWQDLKTNGLSSDVEFAIALSSPAMAQNRFGYLALVEADGSTEFLRTGPHAGGPVSTGTGTGTGHADSVCATSETTTYELTSATATKWKRGGYPGSGHWGAATNEHGCIVVLNSGIGNQGYETDVYWGHDVEQRHGLVPDVPGPTGLADGAVWVREAGLTEIPGELSLYRTDLNTGETETFLTWPTHSEPDSAGGGRLNYDDSYASDLFEHNGRLYYLEDLLVVREGERHHVKPGINGAQLRLAEIDPATTRYRSSFVQYGTDGLQSGEPRPGLTYATLSALRRGHLHDGVIYTGDGEGSIAAVDIETRKVRTAVRLTAEAAEAVSASAAWHEHEVTLFLADAGGNVTRQTYDLKTGKIAGTQRLSGFAELLGAGLDLGNAAKR